MCFPSHLNEVISYCGNGEKQSILTNWRFPTAVTYNHWYIISVSKVKSVLQKKKCFKNVLFEEISPQRKMNRVWTESGSPPGARMKCFPSGV